MAYSMFGMTSPPDQPRPRMPFPQVADEYIEAALRPRALKLGAALLILAALPGLVVFGGESFTYVGPSGRANPATTSFLYLILGVLFIVLVTMVLAGRHWARTAVTVMSALFGFSMLRILSTGIISGGA